MNVAPSPYLEQAVQRHFGVSAEDAASVLARLEPVVCRGGDWLFRQGDPGDALYLLARGRLQVWMQAAEDGAGEAPRRVAEVEPGEIVGEIGVLTGGPRSAGIRALRSSLLLRMDAAALAQLGRAQPELLLRLAGGIASRLRDRTGGAPTEQRRLHNIVLLSLDAPDAAADLAAQLAARLASRGPVRQLSATDFAAHDVGGAPDPDATTVRVVDWLASEEDRHRFVLLVADPRDPRWTDVALRHADLVLLVADGRGPPSRRPWETALLRAPGGPAARRALVLRHAGSPERLAGTRAWLEAHDVDFHLHLRDGVPADLDRLARVLAGEAIGLVLGGGGARGFAHLGVYRALEESGTPVDWVGGSSIGAVMGAGIAMALPSATVIERARAAFVGGRPFNDATIPVVSLLRGRRMERLIAEHMQGDIEDLPLPFFCVSSNLGDGMRRVHARGSLALALRASASLPGVFPPAVVDGQLAIDGGILDNLPVDLMRGRPVGAVVAVDVTSRQDYRVPYDVVPSPWAVLAGRWLPFARRHRVPSFLSLLLKATEIGTMADVRAAGRRADVLVRPEVARFSLTQVRAFDAIVAAGYDAGRAALAAMTPPASSVVAATPAQRPRDARQETPA